MSTSEACQVCGAVIKEGGTFMRGTDPAGNTTCILCVPCGKTAQKAIAAKSKAHKLRPTPTPQPKKKKKRKPW